MSGVIQLISICGLAVKKYLLIIKCAVSGAISLGEKAMINNLYPIERACRPNGTVQARIIDMAGEFVCNYYGFTTHTKASFQLDTT